LPGRRGGGHFQGDPDDPGEAARQLRGHAGVARRCLRHAHLLQRARRGPHAAACSRKTGEIRRRSGTASSRWPTNNRVPLPPDERPMRAALLTPPAPCRGSCGRAAATRPGARSRSPPFRSWAKPTSCSAR
jgi:hypothetical protein